MQIVEFDNYTKIIADPGKVIIKNSFHFAVDSPHVVLPDDSLDDYSEISRVDYMNSLDSLVKEYGEPNYHDIYPGSEFPEDEAAFIPEEPEEEEIEEPAAIEEPEEEEIEEPIEEEEPTDDEEDYEYYEDDEEEPELDIEPADDGDDSDEGVSEEEPSEDSEEASEETTRGGRKLN